MVGNFIEIIKKLLEYRCNWTKKVCLFGAGENGTNAIYDLVTYLCGFSVDFYCDNIKAGMIINDLPVYDLSYIKEKYEDVLFIITVYGQPEHTILKQLKSNGYKDILILNDYAIVDELERYLVENANENQRAMFKNLVDDSIYLEYLFKRRMGYKFEISNPQTFNEKLQWLKVNDRNPLYPIWTDKYRVREYIAENIGEEYLIPFVAKLNSADELTSDIIPDYPVIVKTNAGCHDYTIIRDKSIIDWKALREKYDVLLKNNYYYAGREWHYKDITPCIVVEKLLLTKDKKIPNDYKLTFFNGEFQFAYCAIDREGLNYRKIYDENWNMLPFIMGEENQIDYINPDIPKPESFEDMIKIGKKISDGRRYVRVDFYDVEGKLYLGEITLCHGAGFDKFKPESQDLYWGQRLNL